MGWFLLKKLGFGLLIVVAMVVPVTMFYLFLVLGIIAGDCVEDGQELRV
jgi:hypothetical protein